MSDNLVFFGIQVGSPVTARWAGSTWCEISFYHNLKEFFVVIEHQDTIGYTLNVYNLECWADFKQVRESLKEILVMDEDDVAQWDKLCDEALELNREQLEDEEDSND